MIYGQRLSARTPLQAAMHYSIPPFLSAILGVLAAALFMDSFVHWVALIQTSLAKHGGDFLGPAKRRLLPTTPFLVFLHPVPYFIVAVIVISILSIYGSIARDWWFFGGFYSYAALMTLIVLLLHGPPPAGNPPSMSFWPINILARWRYERQYRAVWAMFLVQGSFARLSKEQQAEVTQRVRELLLRSGVNIYVIPPNSPFLTYIFAGQMKALGIAPALDGEPWPLPEKFVLPIIKPNALGIWIPRGVSSLFWKGLYLANVYRRGGEPVEAARSAMIARGLDVSGSITASEWPLGRGLRRGT